MTKFEACPNSKHLQTNKSNIFQTLKFVLVWVKNRKCWLPAFSPFSTMFSKAFFSRVVKSVVRVNDLKPVDLNTMFSKKECWKPAFAPFFFLCALYYFQALQFASISPPQEFSYDIAFI